MSNLGFHLFLCSRDTYMNHLTAQKETYISEINYYYAITFVWDTEILADTQTCTSFVCLFFHTVMQRLVQLAVPFGVLHELLKKKWYFPENSWSSNTEAGPCPDFLDCSGPFGAMTYATVAFMHTHLLSVFVVCLFLVRLKLQINLGWQKTGNVW